MWVITVHKKRGPEVFSFYSLKFGWPVFRRQAQLHDKVTLEFRP